MALATISRRSAEFDLMTALRSMAKHGDATRLEGAERETHERAAASLGLDPVSARGLCVPLTALVPSKRSMPTTSDVAGAIPTLLAPAASFSDVLRAKSVVGQLGGSYVHLFDGHRPIAIPKKASTTPAVWIAPDDDADFGKLTVAPDDDPDPKVAVAATTVTRLGWGSMKSDGRDFVINDLAGSLAAALDSAILVGAGGLEPVGLLDAAAGVPVVAIGANGGAATRAVLVATMKAVAQANGNAAADARMGWVGSINVESKLRLTDGGMGDGALWNDRDVIIGRPAVSTTSLPDDGAKGSGTGLGSLIFGDWSSVVVNLPEAVQLVVDPVSLGASGSIRLISFLDAKVVFRHAESFAIIKDITTS